MTLHFRIMFDDRINVGKSNKLKGESNYHIWKLKMKALLLREDLWYLVESQVSPVSFPATVNGVTIVTESALTNTTRKPCKKDPRPKSAAVLFCKVFQQCEFKHKAHAGILMSVKDDMIDSVAEKLDPIEAWDMLKQMFEIGDPTQIQLLTSKLYTLSVKRGGDVEQYLKSARETRNKLAALGENSRETNG